MDSRSNDQYLVRVTPSVLIINSVRKADMHQTFNVSSSWHLADRHSANWPVAPGSAQPLEPALSGFSALRSCAYVCLQSKTILQGTVIVGRRQGRQRKRWEDTIREWTGLEFAKSQRAVENREKWRKLVAKSSVVPQRPSRLRD